MQRTLVLITLLGIVVVSVAVGALAANWPFWSRAMAWQSAAPGWPAALRGPWQVLQPGADAPLAIEVDAALADLAATGTQVLMVGSADRVRAWFAEGYTAQSPVDGRALSALLPSLMMGVLASREPALLDEPLGQRVKDWAEDARGAITPRQLLWQLSGLPAGPFQFLNPFSAQAALRSGPDLRRAVLDIDSAYPPGSHFEPAPANAQLLAMMVEEVTGKGFAQAVQEEIWSAVATQPARGLLDHRRGTMAAHCCFTAAAQDWLRLGLLMAGNGQEGSRSLLSPAYLASIRQQSPVHPGQGLGMAIERDAQGHGILVLETSGRLLAAAPGRGRALFWSGDTLSAELRSRLLEMLPRQP